MIPTNCQHSTGRFVLSWLMIFQLIFPLSFFSQSALADAQMDVVSPHIEHEPLTTSLLSDGNGHSVIVTVTDNQSVQAVKIYYRVEGQKAYSSLVMNRIGNSNDYNAFIPATDVKEPGIEYYIQAKDKVGNASLRGFSFEPLIIAVTAPGTDEDEVMANRPFTVEDRKDVPVKKEKKGISKWWWVVGGVAIAALAAGGGGGGDSSSSGSGKREVTIDVAVP